jgi:hypothetical protein
MKKPKKGPAFSSDEQRFPQEIKNLSPGPGEYKESNQWNKRTYNILFAEI